MSNNEFASVVILSYNRPEYLRRSVESLHLHTSYPYELIVVSDGSIDAQERRVVYELVESKLVSTAIINAGRNLGIGTGINRGFRASSGAFLVKADADFEYKEGWLEEATDLLGIFPEIGVLGLFHYFHDPCHWKKKFIEYREKDGKKVEIVEDFVGLGAMRREVWEKNGLFTEDGRAFAEDVDYKLRLQSRGYLLGLPLEDKVVNVGFGEQHSSLIKSIGTPGDPATYIYNIPTQERLIFSRGKPIVDNPKG